MTPFPRRGRDYLMESDYEVELRRRELRFIEY